MAVTRTAHRIPGVSGMSGGWNDGQWNAQRTKFIHKPNKLTVELNKRLAPAERIVGVAYDAQDGAMIVITESFGLGPL